MQETKFLPLPSGQTVASSRLRGLAAILFRQRRAVLITFAGVLLGASLAVVLSPREYSAEVKILVRRERQDPMVSPNSTADNRASRGLTEQEVNSEVDLLHSRDLLERVVLASGLDQKPEGWSVSRMLGGKKDPAAERQEHIAKQVRKLEEDLKVDPPRKSNLISVSYRSSDPQVAARVLNSLAELYVEKHVEVHRPEGTYEFFQGEAQRHKEELASLQGQLVEFTQREDVISAGEEKGEALTRMGDFNATLRQIEASIAETENRIGNLRQQLKDTPARSVTQVRNRADVISALNEKLYELQMKRSEMLTKYEPTYRPVRDLDMQIEEAKLAIAEAEKAPIREEITDENPTYKWLNSELARASAELAALRARRGSMAATVQGYRTRAQQLEGKALAQADLQRAIKTAEENYTLYLRKQEEARMADALDRQRILNVAIAERATVPALADTNLKAQLLAALMLAMFLSVGLAWVKDYWDASFRTPDEVRQYLNLPVLAAIPGPQRMLPAAPVTMEMAGAEAQGD